MIELFQMCGTDARLLRTRKRKIIFLHVLYVSVLTCRASENLATLPAPNVLFTFSILAYPRILFVKLALVL